MISASPIAVHKRERARAPLRHLPHEAVVGNDGMALVGNLVRRPEAHAVAVLAGGYRDATTGRPVRQRIARHASMGLVALGFDIRWKR